MSESRIHLLTHPGNVTVSTVVCGDPSAALATWDDTRVTCPACQRHCRCGPDGGRCDVCRTWNAAHRGRPTTRPLLRTEKQFQEAVRQLALTHGFLYFHVHDARKSPPGYPDVTLVKDTRLVFCELKMPGKRPTPPQQLWLDALAKVTQVSTYVWTPDDWQEIEETLR